MQKREREREREKVRHQSLWKKGKLYNKLHTCVSRIFDETKKVTNKWNACIKKVLIKDRRVVDSSCKCAREPNIEIFLLSVSVEASIFLYIADTRFCNPLPKSVAPSASKNPREVKVMDDVSSQLSQLEHWSWRFRKVHTDHQSKKACRYWHSCLDSGSKE